MENVHEKRLGQPFTVELLNRELRTNRLSRTCAYLFFILGISEVMYWSLSTLWLLLNHEAVEPCLQVGATKFQVKFQKTAFALSNVNDKNHKMSCHFSRRLVCHR